MVIVDGEEPQSENKRFVQSYKYIHRHTITHQTDQQTQVDQEFNAHSTHRQLAEIQLKGILNDPELSFSHITKDEIKYELEDLASRLNTQSWLVKRLLHAMGLENTDTIGKRDVLALTRVMNGSSDARALLFFKIVDTDDDQQVTQEELHQFFSEYLDGIAFFKDNKNNEGDVLRQPTILKTLLEKFNLHQASSIDFDQFYTLVLNDPLLMDVFSRFTVHPSWLNADRAVESKKTNSRKKENIQPPWSIKGLMLLVLGNTIRMYQSLYNGLEEKLSLDYLYDNLSRVVFLLVYVSVSIALFIYVTIYRIGLHTSWLEVIARICGMQLNFNCMMMIVMMLRYTMGLIRRNRFLYRLIPVDDAISIHKMIGRWIVVLVFIHALFHMIYFGTGELGYSWAVCMFTARADIGWIGITPFLGVFLTITLVIMVIGSLKFVRRGGHFEIFYWTHLLYILFYILLILHARNFWNWLIGPGTIFILEKIYYFYKRHSKSNGKTLLHSVTIEQANVVKLSIHRPHGFHFKSGDYILLNIPRVARFEWHPYTLSSAPENRELLTVHLQSAGNWTDKVFNRYQEMVSENSKLSGADLEAAAAEQVWIDGPYGTSTRFIFNCSHAILIGAGIGITPYASILSSLLAQNRDQSCCGPSFNSQKRPVKLDFVWINRSMNNFEWFLKLLENLEKEQESWKCVETSSTKTTKASGDRFLDIHLYFTDIKQDANIGSVPLDLVTRVYEEVCHEDVFTRLKTKTRLGRPNWDELFETILAKDVHNKKKDANVFFCGPKSMTETVKVACKKHKIKFHKEEF